MKPGWLVLSLSATLLGVACGSSDATKAVASGGGESGAPDGQAGLSHGEGGSEHGGGNSLGGVGTGDDNFGGRSPAEGGVASDGGVPNGAGGSDSGSGGDGQGGATEEPGVQRVSSYGCFAVSGDGWDMLPGGVPAVMIADAEGTRCGGRPIADNAAGLAAELTPTRLRFTRQFVVDDALLVGGSFGLSFAADDQATFVLNGEEIASCLPPESDIGKCSAACTTLAIPTEKLRGGGQINTLQIELVNLLSVPAGGGDFGWTSQLYSMCVAETSTLRGWDASADFRPTPNQENPGRDAFGNAGVWHYLERPVGALDATDDSYLSTFLVDATTSRWQSPSRSSFHQVGRVNSGGSLFAHPENAGDVIIAWESPIAGSVSIVGSLTDVDTSCGNGVAFHLDFGETPLASGSVLNDTVPLDTDRLTAIDVEPGDRLSLVISAAGEHSCDTTSVDLRIIPTH
jgi:hypothetical protein